MFIDSLGDKVQFESGNAQPVYQILQSMPRKEFRDREKTLGEVGLFPRAALQVQELDPETS